MKFLSTPDSGSPGTVIKSLFFFCFQDRKGTQLWPAGLDMLTQFFPRLLLTACSRNERIPCISNLLSKDVVTWTSKQSEAWNAKGCSQKVLWIFCRFV